MKNIPAFPVIEEPKYIQIQSKENYHLGMPLRDYFANHASDGDIHEIMYRKENLTNNHEGGIIFLITRQQARYIHADAMLKEREKHE